MSLLINPVLFLLAAKAFALPPGSADFSGALAYVCAAGEAPRTAAFGGCDRERGEPCAAATKFRIGSMSKSFTAAAVLALADDHLLSLDDELSKWLPEYPAANLQKNGVAVNLRHLLTHESGVHAWEDTPFFHSHIFVSAVTLEQIRDAVSSRPLDATPGTAYVYSNTGYNLLALVVERASGEKFEGFLTRRVIGAAKLQDTGITLPAQAGLAKGYYFDDNAWWSMYDEAEFVDRDLSAVNGSGSVYSTTADVLAWMKAFSGGAVVSPAAVADALTPRLGSYGYGWLKHKLHDTELDWHNGELNPVGFYSEMGFNAARGFSYALLTNVNADNINLDALKQVHQQIIDDCKL